MTLPPAPPEDSAYSVGPGDFGWYVYAIQVAMNELGSSLTADGNFGASTAKAVTAFQAKYGLYQDAVAGPVTQPKIVAVLGAAVEAKHDWLARGYVRGISRAEASGMISAVNWSVEGGVDCGPVQRRVLGPPYAPNDLKQAFDVAASLERIAADWRVRRDLFLTTAYAWSDGDHERSGRCAALAHNWPAGAYGMAKNGAVPGARTKASWIPRDENGVSLVHFPDGALVDTQGQWATFYALGGAHGEGIVSRYVTDWR